MYLTQLIQILISRIKRIYTVKRVVYASVLLTLPVLFALSAWLDITFEGKNVSLQIPAEITFDLDLSNIESDNIYIRKSKEDLDGFRVSKTQKEWKTVYQYPGYYKAQLIVDNKLVKVHDVFVKSYGWAGTLSHDGQVEYLSEKDLKCEAMIGLSETKLNSILKTDTPPTLTFHYFDQINPVSGLDFTLETRLRHTYNSYVAPCRNIQIEVVGTNSSFQIPLSINACSTDNPLVIAGHEYYTTQVDLKKLQADYSQWQQFKMEVNGGLVKFYLNDQQQLTVPVLSSIGQVVGFRYHFEGAGEVDQVKLTDTRDVIYAAPF